MNTISKTMSGICVMWSASTMADQPVEYWGCKFNEGKAIGDLMGWTEKWDKWPTVCPTKATVRGS